MIVRRYLLILLSSWCNCAMTQVWSQLLTCSDSASLSNPLHSLHRLSALKFRRYCGPVDVPHEAL